MGRDEALGWFPQGLPAQGAQHSLAVTPSSWTVHNTPKSHAVTANTLWDPLPGDKGTVLFSLGVTLSPCAYRPGSPSSAPPRSCPWFYPSSPPNANRGGQTEGVPAIGARGLPGTAPAAPAPAPAPRAGVCGKVTWLTLPALQKIRTGLIASGQPLGDSKPESCRTKSRHCQVPALLQLSQAAITHNLSWLHAGRLVRNGLVKPSRYSHISQSRRAG